MVTQAGNRPQSHSPRGQAPENEKAPPKAELSTGSEREIRAIVRTARERKRHLPFFSRATSQSTRRNVLREPMLIQLVSTIVGNFESKRNNFNC